MEAELNMGIFSQALNVKHQLDLSLRFHRRPTHLPHNNRTTRNNPWPESVPLPSDSWQEVTVEPRQPVPLFFPTTRPSLALSGQLCKVKYKLGISNGEEISTPVKNVTIVLVNIFLLRSPFPEQGERFKVWVFQNTERTISNQKVSMGVISRKTNIPTGNGIQQGLNQPYPGAGSRAERPQKESWGCPKAGGPSQSWAPQPHR